MTFLANAFVSYLSQSEGAPVVRVSRFTGFPYRRKLVIYVPEKDGGCIHQFEMSEVRYAKFMVEFEDDAFHVVMQSDRRIYLAVFDTGDKAALFLKDIYKKVSGAWSWAWITVAVLALLFIFNAPISTGQNVQSPASAAKIGQAPASSMGAPIVSQRVMPAQTEATANPLTSTEALGRDANDPFGLKIAPSKP